MLETVSISLSVLFRDKPISAQIGMKKAAEHDEEGRLITLEFDAFFLVNVYVSLSLFFSSAIFCA